MIQPDENGLYHPENEGQIVELIQYARQRRVQVRVRGAAQSIPGAVFTDGFVSSAENVTPNINMELDRMRSLSFDEGALQVTVQAGCNLGTDPFDPAGTSTDENSLYGQLNRKGWAIPNVSDAIHQTVAGFISTGSCGGSMTHAFDTCIVAIRLVDGTGLATTYRRTGNTDDPFFALVASLGLLGVITEVTLQCVPAFNIIGEEAVTNVEECPYDFFGSGAPGRPSLQDYLTQTEYARMLWWPYKNLSRMISWKARTMQAADYTPQTGSPTDFKPKPYQPIFPKVFGSRLPAEAFAGIGYTLIASWPHWLYDLMGNNPLEPEIEQLGDALFPYIYPKLADMYFPCNSPAHPPQEFWDNWLGSLPMDRVEFSNNLMPLKYTEMWVPISMARETVGLMQHFYEAGGYAATSFYTLEILGAPKSQFWLSPAYQCDVVRFNIMWFARGASDPAPYFEQLWELFYKNDINFRPHWGKYLPEANGNTGAGYLRGQYPQWDTFMQLRKQMDPDNLFLTTYWKQHLGLQ